MKNPSKINYSPSFEDLCYRLLINRYPQMNNCIWNMSIFMQSSTGGVFSDFSIFKQILDFCINKCKERKAYYEQAIEKNLQCVYNPYKETGPIFAAMVFEYPDTEFHPEKGVYTTAFFEFVRDKYGYREMNDNEIIQWYKHLSVMDQSKIATHMAVAYPKINFSPIDNDFPSVFFSLMKEYYSPYENDPRADKAILQWYATLSYEKHCEIASDLNAAYPNVNFDPKKKNYLVSPSIAWEHSLNDDEIIRWYETLGDEDKFKVDTLFRYRKGTARQFKGLLQWLEKYEGKLLKSEHLCWIYLYEFRSCFDYFLSNDESYLYEWILSTEHDEIWKEIWKKITPFYFERRYYKDNEKMCELSNSFNYFLFAVQYAHNHGKERYARKLAKQFIDEMSQFYNFSQRYIRSNNRFTIIWILCQQILLEYEGAEGDIYSPFQSSLKRLKAVQDFDAYINQIDLYLDCIFCAFCLNDATAIPSFVKEIVSLMNDAEDEGHKDGIEYLSLEKQNILKSTLRFINVVYSYIAGAQDVSHTVSALQSWSKAMQLLEPFDTPPAPLAEEKWSSLFACIYTHVCSVVVSNLSVPYKLSLRDGWFCYDLTSHNVARNDADTIRQYFYDDDDDSNWIPF